MKISLPVLIGGILIATLAWAQPATPPGGKDDGGPPPRHDGAGPGGRDRGAEGRDGRGGPGAGQPRPGPLEQMRNYLDVVDRYSRIAGSATSSGIAAVISAADILRPQGPKAIIEYMQKLLPEVKDPAVQRAIRLQLADMYRQSQQPDKALEQLDLLIKATPGSQ